MLVAGVLAMGASGFAHGRINRPTILVALANSAVIAIYSVIDGQGARLSGAGSAFAFAYNSWADALTALAYLPIILFLRGRAAVAAFAGDWRRGLIGGLAAFFGYAIVIWAMTRAPIAAVAALRETSVVFAAIIGVVALGEPFHSATRDRRARHSRGHHPSALRLIERRSRLLRALPLKIDLAARADRVEHRRVRVGDPVKLVSFERSAGLPRRCKSPAGSTLRKRMLQEQVEMAARFAEREAGRGEQRFGRCRLEYPAHALLGLHDGDRRIAVIGHQRSQRVALGQDIGRVVGARLGVEIARELAKALEARQRIDGPSGTAPVMVSAKVSAATTSPIGAAHRAAFAIAAAKPEAPLRRISATQSAARIADGRIERREPVALDAVVKRMQKEIDRRRRDRAGENAPGFVARAGQDGARARGWPRARATSAAKTSGLMSPICATMNSAK